MFNDVAVIVVMSTALHGMCTIHARTHHACMMTDLGSRTHSYVAGLYVFICVQYVFICVQYNYARTVEYDL